VDDWVAVREKGTVYGFCVTCITLIDPLKPPYLGWGNNQGSRPKWP